MTDKIEIGQGHERYEWYHYLWHLIAIRAVKLRKVEDDAQVTKGVAYLLEADAWALLETDTPGKGEVIAQIDTGVNASHPNLAPRILPAVSFAAHPFGLCYVERKEQPPLLRGQERRLSKSFISDDTWKKAAELLDENDPLQKSLFDRLESGRGVEQETAQTSRMRYSAHGTACAGLIVGAPPVASANSRRPDDGDGPIPYWGVAPGAELLPIEISARPDAEQLILAFLFAWDQQVSVIHFPREVPDPWQAHRYCKGYGDSRYISDKAKAGWDYFKKLFEAISEDIPIVCAAGNNGYDHLIYPASTATEHNGVIAVGAVTYLAKRSAYSNYSNTPDNSAVTIAAPSDDQEVYTRYQMRLDKEAARSRDHNFEIHEKSVPQVDFAPQGVLTVDIPGRHGYSGGQLEGIQPASVENMDRAALYTVFGGTSAASAVVAGAVALLQSKRRKDREQMNGKDAKAKVALSGAREVSWPWLEEAKVVPIEPDYLNGEKVRIAFNQQFGAGLLDLRKLLS